MFNHSGYRVPDGDRPPYPAPLWVMSAGHYRFVKMPQLHTHRPQGRPDYQLLYLVGGTAEFSVRGERQKIAEGGMVLYCPQEEQEYWYRLDEQPDVYWVHFTGTEADAFTAELGLHGGVYTVGMDIRYRELMEALIRELQLKRSLADEMTEALLRELLVRMARRDREMHTVLPRSPMVDRAVREIERRFAEPLTVTELAVQSNVEACWFSRLFRRQVGMSPQQYLMSVRMTKARELLSTTDCSVGEVARLTGYDNPLYFSRLFRRQCGCSPREYRQQKGGLR